MADNDARSLGVNISLSIKMLGDVDFQANKEGISRSELVRKAISLYLSNKFS
jgi:metal-responsive CopG/Arc/MetJ family transcriptional regulator